MIENAAIQNVRMLPDGRMDAKNAALYSGLATRTLAQKRWDGTGPKFIKPGRVFYFKDDIDAWLMANGKSSSTTQAGA